MTAKDEILELLEGLPDTTTYADAFDQLRPLYNRAVAPIIAQYGEPPGPSGPWRREITDPAAMQEQRRVGINKADPLRLVQSLPARASQAETVDKAMYQLVISYSIDRDCRQIADGQGIPHHDVREHLIQWRG